MGISPGSRRAARRPFEGTIAQGSGASTSAVDAPGSRRAVAGTAGPRCALCGQSGVFAPCRARTPCSRPTHCWRRQPNESFGCSRSRRLNRPRRRKWLRFEPHARNRRAQCTNTRATTPLQWLFNCSYGASRRSRNRSDWSVATMSSGMLPPCCRNCLARFPVVHCRLDASSTPATYLKTC